MKNWIASLLLCLPLLGFGQKCELPLNEEGLFELVEVVQVADASKGQLYLSSLKALGQVIGNLNDVIQIKSEEMGMIVAHVQAISPNRVFGIDHIFTFELKLEFKEGRYRISVQYVGHLSISADSQCACSNPIVDRKCGTAFCMTKSQWNKHKCRAYQDLQDMLKQIKESVDYLVHIKKSDDDW